MASDTENQTGLPDDLATAEMRQQRAIDIVSCTGRNVHLNDSQPLTERFALLAHGKSIVDDQFARVIGTQVADSKVRLVNGIKAALAEDAFVKGLLRDSTRTSPAEAAFMAAFEQHICGSDQFPHQLWRLVAVCQHHDIWVLDVLHWRFSCYSCHAGPLHIKGRLAKSGMHKVLSKEWNQPGYHFRIGQIAVPSALSEHGSGCTLYILDPSGKILSTSLRPQPQLPALDTVTQSLATLGLEHAAFDVTASGVSIPLAVVALSLHGLAELHAPF